MIPLENEPTVQDKMFFVSFCRFYSYLACNTQRGKYIFKNDSEFRSFIDSKTKDSILISLQTEEGIVVRHQFEVAEQ